MSMDELTSEILHRLASNQRVRRELPFGGRLHIDRPLPFLCLYRRPDGQEDAGTGDLVKGEASFITTTAAKTANADLSRLVTRIAEAMSGQFGALLIVEIWSAPDRLTPTLTIWCSSWRHNPLNFT